MPRRFEVTDDPKERERADNAYSADDADAAALTRPQPDQTGLEVELAGEWYFELGLHRVDAEAVDEYEREDRAWSPGEP